MATEHADFLIIGGGVIGLNLALEAARRFTDCSVTLIEKEADCGRHASGRNSGVLHAGFYYSDDSLKARFARDGNRAMTEFCLQHKLPINQCGKLVVAKNEQEHEVLDVLLARARKNRVELHEVTEQEAKQIEPLVKTCQRALFSPTTSTVSPSHVIDLLVRKAREKGIKILSDTAYLGRDRGGILTNRGRIEAGYVINAAGLYADKIARDYGFSSDYKIIPFKGLYLYSERAQGPLRTNIYPVPDLANPFLGVHVTVTHEGRNKLGPTAIPAFWREHYKGFENFNLPEMFDVLREEMGLFLSNRFNFRRLAVHELSKYYRPRMVSLASELAQGIDTRHYKKWGPAGIRAQLYNTRKKCLEMDFLFEGDGDSFHVLNAVSPAFTCAIPFTKYLVDEIEKRVGP